METWLWFFGFVESSNTLYFLEKVFGTHLAFCTDQPFDEITHRLWDSCLHAHACRFDLEIVHPVCWGTGDVRCIFYGLLLSRNVRYLISRWHINIEDLNQSNRCSFLMALCSKAIRDLIESLANAIVVLTKCGMAMGVVLCIFFDTYAASSIL